jgi:hypothetical protein
MCLLPQRHASEAIRSLEYGRFAMAATSRLHY